MKYFHLTLLKVFLILLCPDIFTNTTVNIRPIIRTLSEIWRWTGAGFHNKDENFTPSSDSGFLGTRLWGVDLHAGNIPSSTVGVNTRSQVKADGQVERDVVRTKASADFMKEGSSGAGQPYNIAPHQHKGSIPLYLSIDQFLQGASAQEWDWSLTHGLCSARGSAQRGHAAACCQQPTLPQLGERVLWSWREGLGSMSQHSLHLFKKNRPVWGTLLFLVFHSCL